MRLLSRYVRGYFLTYLVSGLAACAGLLLLVDLFDRIDTFIGRQVLWIDAIHYLAMKLPWMVYQMMPAACLLPLRGADRVRCPPGEVGWFRAGLQHERRCAPMGCGRLSLRRHPSMS